MTEKIYYSDLSNCVDVCFSCKSQDIVHYTTESFCNNCKSEDVVIIIMIILVLVVRMYK